MKRSPLRRTTPLKSSKSLKREDGAFLKQRPAAPWHNEELGLARQAVIKRSGGYCEAKIRGQCTGYGYHAHHRRRRSQGGPDSAANLSWLCSNCHLWVHGHPKLSMECGLLLRQGDDPEQTPVDYVAAMGIAQRGKRLE